MATMYVIAGPNSSGKSTLAEQQFDSKDIDLVNADYLYTEMKEKMPGIDTKEVWNQFEQRIDSHIKGNRDFAVESTLTDDKTLSKMQDAKEKGFHVDLAYVSLNNVSDHFDRLGNTLSSKESFDREVQDSYGKLPEAMKIADSVKIYNNSKDAPELIVQMDPEKDIYINEKANIPDPVAKAILTHHAEIAGINNPEKIQESRPLSDLDVKIINPIGDPIAELRGDFDDRNHDVKGFTKDQDRMDEKDTLNKEIEKEPESRINLKGRAEDIKDKPIPELAEYVSQKENVRKLDQRLADSDLKVTEEKQQEQEQAKDRELVKNMEKTEELSMAM
ncbi:MAG: hypothetical protein KJ737_04375 [Proteobacteria bacterium]|nr:hypothetical protein [Pseudomonadota bacterium]